MHFEILVEDRSGKKMLDILVQKIIGDDHTFKIYPYEGLGHIPKMNSPVAAKNHLLLNNLPRILRGYGRSMQNSSSAVFVVCDLDNKCLKTFRQELLKVLRECNPKPETRFCIAVKEGEAWLLGDIPAIKKAYPEAKDTVLNKYENDSICGTWEKLADAVHKGGSPALSKKGGYADIGKKKSQWAEKISPYMDVAQNKSSSFVYFRQKLLEFL